MDKKELLFSMYKDEIVIGSSSKFKREVKKKYNLDNREAADLYVRINNYQIKTYGSPLNDNVDFIYMDRQEREKSYTRSHSRKSSKIHKWDENTKHNRKFDYL